MAVTFIFYLRCAIPGIDNDTYLPDDDAHAALRNLSIPYNGDTWDACHLYQDVPFAHDVNRTDNVTFFANRSKVPCSRWVFDKSTFESTIATDVSVFFSVVVHTGCADIRLTKLTGLLSA